MIKGFQAYLKPWQDSPFQSSQCPPLETLLDKALAAVLPLPSVLDVSVQSIMNAPVEPHKGLHTLSIVGEQLGQNPHGRCCPGQAQKGQGLSRRLNPFQHGPARLRFL